MAQTSIARRALFNEPRFRELMAEERLDGVVSVSPANVTYTSGYHNIDMIILPEHLHAVVWPVEGRPAMLMSDRPNPMNAFVEDVRRYPPFGAPGEDVAMLVDMVREAGLDGRRVGVELAHLPASRHAALQRALPHVTWVEAGHVLERARSVKTPAEIALLRQAARATDRAIALAYAQARPTDTEKAVSDAMSSNVMRFGADIVAFNVVASGPRTPMGHHLAEPVPLKAGDIMRCDFGALFDGYYTDLARMAVVGRPSQRQRDIYARYLEVHRRTLAAVRPGVTGEALFEASAGAYREAGLPGRAMCGHSIGLVIHERPVAARGEAWTLEEGMVLCIENGATIADRAERYHVEDMLVVTAAGHEVLSTYSDVERMAVIE